MNGTDRILRILLIDDDRDSLQLLEETLPKFLDGYEIIWEPCDNFPEAMKRVKALRYDLVATDVYMDGNLPKVDSTDAEAVNIINAIREARFCPVIAFSDGPQPSTIQPSLLIKFADKSNGNDAIIAALRELLSTGIPLVSGNLHKELDRAGGSYLWTFVENRWAQLEAAGLTDSTALERLVKRRAAVQLGRLKAKPDGDKEMGTVDPVDFYLWPAIAGDEIRLGEIIRRKPEGEFRVVLTPHCHLHVQPGDAEARADFVLTAKTCNAKDVIGTLPRPWNGGEDEKMEKLRRRINSPADSVPKPAGRYWYLPRFLDIPHLYCDFMQVESISRQSLDADYERIAVLDTPYAEAMQSCFIRFYSAVGIPVVNRDSVMDLMS